MPWFPVRRATMPLAGITVLAGVVLAGPARPQQALASTTAPFRMGVPTVVDPIRAAGEPMMAVDNSGNPYDTGPAGTGTQTSWFWHSRDGGQTFPLLGPSGGHMVCPASGGGDSSALIDRQNNDAYLIDQEALADLGFARISGADGSMTTACASAPTVTADRPFEAVLHPAASQTMIAPQYRANGSKPLVYLSYLCDACGTSSAGNAGGLAFGWSADGTTWHAADPGVTADNLVAAQFQEASTINAFQWHGNMVADPRTGDVFTALSCSGGSCPNGASGNQFGIAVGTPQANPTGNIGQFASLTYQTAATQNPDGSPLDPGDLFPVLSMDSAHTLYLMWVEGDGFADPTVAPPANDWHVYYTYSRDTAADNHMHKTWSPVIRVDNVPQTQTVAMAWMVAGAPGHLGFIWLGSDVRAHPSETGMPTRKWFPFFSVTTDATSATPHFSTQRVGRNPNHLGDICLQGTVGCVETVGNRNMADFVSVDVGPDGALQGTWAADANQLATLPTTLIPGAPVTMYSREVSGPRLVGAGGVTPPAAFSTTPTTAGISDASGDALYPVQGGTDVPQLDLTGVQVSWVGGNLQIHVSVANASSLTSPDTTNQTHVWWLVTWVYNHRIWFAKAESNGGAAPAFTAGAPKSFDRPGLNGQTVATLVDYSGGKTVTGSLSGNTFTINVNDALVGEPDTGNVLESVTAFTALDNGAPLAVGPGSGNIPTITDATPAYDALLQ